MDLGVRHFGPTPAAVLLVHGAGGNSASLAALGEALAECGVGALTVALPGRDGTPGPAPSDVAAAAGWLADVRAELVPDGAVLLGHSMGGAIAIESALSHPDGVRALVLAATGARLRVHPAILEQMRGAAQEGRSVAEFERAVLRPDTPDEVADRIVAAASRTPAAAALRDWEATDRFDRLAEVGRIAVPTLVIGGSEDQLTPTKYARYLADALPRADLVVLDGAGHWLPVERASEVAAAVARFLDDLG